MLKKAVILTRPAPARQARLFPGEAAGSEDPAAYFFVYVRSLSD